MNTDEVERLYTHYSGPLVLFASSMVGPDEAGDLVADVFARILRNRPDIEHPSAYLYRAVSNAAVAYTRLSGRIEIGLADSMRDYSSEVSHSGSWIEPYIAGLSRQQRAILFLRYVEDLQLVEISERLGVSQGTVKKQLSRAHSGLRNRQESHAGTA